MSHSSVQCDENVLQTLFCTLYVLSEEENIPHPDTASHCQEVKDRERVD